MDPNYLIIAALAFLLAGTIKGTVGIGLPVTTVGILTQVGDARLAVVLTVVPIVVTNLWQVYRSGGFLKSLKEYWIIGLPLVIVLYAAALAAPLVPTKALMTILGLVIVLFATINLLGKTPQISPKFDTIAKVIAGIFGGIFGGLTAIWAPPLVIYFLSKGVEKNQFMGAIGTMFLLGSVPLLLGYLQNGQLTQELGLIGLALCIPAGIGFLIGESIRDKLPAATFRKLVLITFLLTGLNILRLAIF